MRLDFTEEHEGLRHLVRDFARAEVEPHAAEWDRTHTFPAHLVPKLGDLGLFGLTAPEQYGGADADFTSLCIAVEELGYADQSVGITLSAGVGLGISPILKFGTVAQRDRWLPDLVAGRALASFGLTEPDAGSDAGATRTRAELHDGEWVINGSKAFITNSGTPITRCITITARTGLHRSSGDDGRPEISTIIVPAGTPGFTVEPAYDKLGWHASDTHGLTFDDCRVPEDALLGLRGEGLRQMLGILDDGRIAIAALSVGLIQRCLDECTTQATNRVTFGQPIGSRQGVSFAISDLAVDLEAARLLTYDAAAMKDAGRGRAEVSKAAAIAKLFATEAAVRATRTATQVFGGYGFMEESPVARLYRDAKILEIGEGTSEVQRMVIARSLGLPAAS